MTDNNPFSEENAPRRYFEYMEELRLKKIEELEAEVDHLKAEIAHRKIDIQLWKDRATFNSKWNATLAEIRIVIIFGVLAALVSYYLYLDLGVK